MTGGPRVVGLLQARMGSTRLPGKALAAIEGVPMIERILERIRPSSRLSALVVATTTLPEDEALVALAARLGFPSWRGSVEDVLDRFRQAARHHAADVVVRLTADNPFVDAAFVDETVAEFQTAIPPLDYLDTSTSKTFPLGLSVEVISSAALEAAWKEDVDPARREHVTPFIRTNPQRFRVRHRAAERDDSDLRWTVDTPEDLEMVRQLYARLELAKKDVPVRAIIEYVRAHPDLAAINASVRQRTV